MPELVQFETNVPEVVSLAYADGREYPSKIPGAPPQVLYTLEDGRRMFVPISVAQAIRAENIGAGQPFEICRAQISGNRTQYQVRSLAGMTSWQSRPAKPSESHQQQQTTPHHVTALAPASWQAAPAQPQQQQPVTPESTRMMSALCAAVDAAIETQAYARRRGLGVEFSEESIRAMGLTMYIQNARGGQAR